MNITKKQQALSALDKAQAALAVWDFPAAHHAAATAVRLNPDNVQARILLARINLKLQDASHANRALDVVMQIAPELATSPDVATLRARALIQLARYEQAQVVIESLITRFPDDERMYHLGVQLHEKQNTTQLAGQYLEQIIRVNPKNISARRQLARLIATESPQRAAELTADIHDDCLNTQGKTQTTTKAASPRYLKTGGDTFAPAAIQSNATRYEHATYLKQAGRLADAEAVFLELAERTPLDGILWLELGTIADESGAIELALDRLTKSVSCAGDHQIKAASRIATVAMHAGRFGQAAVWWHRVAQSRQVTQLRICEQDRDENQNAQTETQTAVAWAGLVVTATCAQRPRLAQLAYKHLVTVTENTSESELTNEECGLEVTRNQTLRQHLLTRAWVHASSGEVIHCATQFDPDRQISDGGPDRLMNRLLNRAVHTFTNMDDEQHRWADTYFHTAVCEHHLGNAEEASQAVQSSLDINPNYRAAARLAAQLNQSERAGTDSHLQLAA
jgi:tetratricopeptide (TPR) repeat protein